MKGYANILSNAKSPEVMLCSDSGLLKLSEILERWAEGLEKN